MSVADTEYLIGSAAMRLAPTQRVYQALTNGQPVTRRHLATDVLAAIEEPLDGPPLVLDKALALRIEANLGAVEGGAEETVAAAITPDPMRVVSLDQFAGVEEQGAGAILGTEESALIPEGATVMFYGDGGSGKTTLCVDLAFHLAAGDDWLQIAVPGPVRVLVVENEGPRPLFRRKLRRKQESWAGSDLGDRLQVLEDPWARFSFAEEVGRERLAAVIARAEIDVVIVGPVTSSGMEAAGTLQEVRDFAALVDDVRIRSGRSVVFALVHHENRAGQVSGAWEGAGETLFHVQQQGHGKLRLHVQKARGSSEHHATTLHLVWAEGDGFERVEQGPSRPERVWDGIAEYVLAHGGCAWNEVEQAVTGEGSYLRRRRSEMLAEGLLVNAGRGQAFELWHRDDPGRPTLDTTTVSEDRHGSDTAVSATEDGGETATVSPCRSYRTDTASDTVGSASSDDSKSSDAAVGGGEEDA